jgi:hypothetical protein
MAQHSLVMTQKENQNLPSLKPLLDILERGEKGEIRATFELDEETTVDEMVFLFRIWSRHFYPEYFMDETQTYPIEDAPFHDESDERMARCYLGLDPYFIDAGFRGSAKTSRKKLFRAFVIANDKIHRKKYFKVLTKDPLNSKQIVTDIFNMFVNPRVRHYYPEIFAKTEEKRSEAMSEFDTATGIKMLAGVVTSSQRGQLQESARPDDVWCDDFETRKVLRSAVMLNDIWDNMEEARTGLSMNGSATYTCNYLSERGNVHKLIQKYPEYTMITPIKGTIVNGAHVDGAPTWRAKYTPEQVERILRDADDPAGEYLCVPSAGDDIFFDRQCLLKQERKTPIKLYADFKVFHLFNPAHRYGGGMDIAGGVGLDHSTSVFIDFSTVPARVVGTFKSNTIKPDIFAHEIERQACIFGRPLVAPENNRFDVCVGKLKEIYDNVFITPDKATKGSRTARTFYYGWNTNPLTKPTMLFALKKAVEDGLLELSDPDIIAELWAMTRDDFMDKEEDPRLTTRHFDFVIATAIAWMMKDHALQQTEDTYEQAPYEGSSEYEGSYTNFNASQLHQNNIHPV